MHQGGYCSRQRKHHIGTMSIRFDKLAEQQIKKAQAEGQLDNLEGTGKPLKKKGGINSSLSSGYAIMAEAGVVPKEIELRKQIEALNIALKNTHDESAQKQFKKTLADLQLRLAIEQDARRKYMRVSR